MKTIEEAVKTILASEELKAELAKCDSEEKIIAFFAGLGCDAKIDEINKYMKETGKTSRALSDEELSDVAGGSSLIILTWLAGGIG